MVEGRVRRVRRVGRVRRVLRVRHVRRQRRAARVVTAVTGRARAAFLVVASHCHTRRVKYYGQRARRRDS